MNKIGVKMTRLLNILSTISVIALLLFCISCPKSSTDVEKKEVSITNSYLSDVRKQYKSSIQSWNEKNSTEAKRIINRNAVKTNELDKELIKLKPIELDISQLALNMKNASASEDTLDALYNAFNMELFRSNISEKKNPVCKIIINPFMDAAANSNLMFTANRIGSIGQSDWEAQFRRGLILIHVGAIAGWRLYPTDKEVQSRIKKLNFLVKPGAEPKDVDESKGITTELRVRSMLHSIIERKARLTKPDNTALYLINAFQSSQNLNKNQAAPHYLLAFCYWHAGDLEKAISEIETGNKCKDLNWPLIPPQPNADALVKDQIEAADLFMRYQPPGSGIKRSSRHLLCAAGIWSTPDKTKAILDMWKRLIQLNGPIGDWATLTCSDSMALYVGLQENRSDLIKFKLSNQQLEDWRKPLELLKSQITHKQQLELALELPNDYWSKLHEQIAQRRVVIQESLEPKK